MSEVGDTVSNDISTYELLNPDSKEISDQINKESKKLNNAQTIRDSSSSTLHDDKVISIGLNRKILPSEEVLLDLNISNNTNIRDLSTCTNNTLNNGKLEVILGESFTKSKTGKFVDKGIDPELEQLLDCSEVPSLLKSPLSSQGSSGLTYKRNMTDDEKRTNTLKDGITKSGIESLSKNANQDNETDMSATLEMIQPEDMLDRSEYHDLPNTQTFNDGLREAEDGMLGRGGTTSSHKDRMFSKDVVHDSDEEEVDANDVFYDLCLDKLTSTENIKPDAIHGNDNQAGDPSLACKSIDNLNIRNSNDLGQDMQGYPLPHLTRNNKEQRHRIFDFSDHENSDTENDKNRNCDESEHDNRLSWNRDVIKNTNISSHRTLDQDVVKRPNITGKHLPKTTIGHEYENVARGRSRMARVQHGHRRELFMKKASKEDKKEASKHKTKINKVARKQGDNDIPKSPLENTFGKKILLPRWCPKNIYETCEQTLPRTKGPKRQTQMRPEDNIIRSRKNVGVPPQDDNIEVNIERGNINLKIIPNRPKDCNKESLYRTKYRTAYTRKEEKSIVSFMMENGGYRHRGGTSLWKEMEKRGTCPGRTWQSMKQRFLAYIQYDLDSFRTTKEQLSLADTDDSDISTMDGDITTHTVTEKYRIKNYTRSDDKEILDFIIRNKRFRELGVTSIWRLMEARQVVTGRSWQSLKERFRKVILRRLHAYCLQPNELTQLQGISKLNTRETLHNTL